MSRGRSRRPSGRLASAAARQSSGRTRRRLHRVLALGRRPADVQAVDADAVGLQLVAGVAREGRQRGLRRRVAREHRLAAVAGHRDDVDDAAAAAGAAHEARRLLHEQERRAGVDREEPVPQLGARVIERAAVAQARGVDEPVEATEALVARARRPRGTAPRRRGRRRRRPPRCRARASSSRTASPRSRIAPADDDARRARARRPARDRGAEALRAAGDDDHLAVEALGRERVAHSWLRRPRRRDGPALAQRAPGGQADHQRRARVGGGDRRRRARRAPPRRTPPTRAGSCGM